MDTPKIIDVNGQPFEAKNPVDRDKVSEYVNSYNQEIIIAQKALEGADNWKVLIKGVTTSYPALATDETVKVVTAQAVALEAELEVSKP